MYTAQCLAHRKDLLNTTILLLLSLAGSEDFIFKLFKSIFGLKKAILPHPSGGI